MDGARVSKVSNFVTVSFTILTDSVSQTHTDQKVLAIVNCDENHDNVKKCFGPLFDEINELSSAGVITVGEESYNIEIMVGGDMKFIQLLLGLNGSIGTYACPWCKVAKDNRGDMTFPEGYYHTLEMLRTIQEISDLASTGKSGKQSFGVTGKPLLNIEPIRYVPDELHLLMRITDVLLRNLIDDARSKDEYGRLTGQSCDNLDILVKAIQSCGLTFKIWNAKNGDLDWTSLSGNDKKTLLRELPDKLFFCLHEDTRDRVVSLWKEFSAIYSALCSGEGAEILFETTCQFIQNFIQIGQLKRHGYHPSNVTPYMHVLAYHVPFFVKRYGGLSKFSGQGVEKTNDVIKQVHQMRSSKSDPTTDALLVRKRIEVSSAVTRKPRQYTKQNDSYWCSGIKSRRDAKRWKFFEEMKQVDDAYHGKQNEIVPDTMSVIEIKDKLAKLGVRTKLRKKEKLLQLLRDVSV
ncbi:uncharacterized protein LOC123545375 [Mercenaria mercenaria]|uniref:uncharacterized protein LOC123545375 n=1 Tax=Mercenaria mercenaria TaxID=6596 RepID=UPI00234EA3A4|nr:uncharacterized protein LOC123545375 [Mercenaria mercenaria]